MRKAIVLIVLVMLVMGTGLADSVAAGEFAPLVIAKAPAQIMVDVPQTVTMQDTAKGPFVIPKGVELSTLGGIAFPEVTGGVAVSYLVAQTEGGWALFFVDLGGLFVESSPFAVFLGGSTSLTGPNNGLSTRAGLGYYQPLDWTRGGVFAYLRFPIGPTTATKTEF